MKLNKMLLIACVLTFGVLMAFTESLDTKVTAEADAEALLSRIAMKFCKDNSKVAKSIENEIIEYEKIILTDGKETGLAVPRSRSAKLAVVAGRMAIFGSVSQKLSNTDVDITKLLNILEQSYVAEKGTLGKPDSALVYGLICKNLGKYADSLIWLDRAAEGLKESGLLDSIERAKTDVLREGRDSLKFTGSIAGTFSGTKGWKYEFKLGSLNTENPVFQGYHVAIFDANYSITNVKPGKYLLRIYERRDGDPGDFIEILSVTVEEGKTTSLAVVLPQRLNPISPTDGRQIISEEGGVLNFKWERSAAVKNNYKYDLSISTPESRKAHPKGYVSVGIGELVDGLSVDIPVSKFREKGEYTWVLILKDEKGQAVMPIVQSKTRKFVVK